MKKMTFTFTPQPVTTNLFIGPVFDSQCFKEIISQTSKKFFVLYDAKLLFYKEMIMRALNEIDQEAFEIALEGGENFKCREMKEKIEDTLFENFANRDSCLIAIGGGALLDLIGFVAATYCRGIPYISFPSTLLAMTDASIGGKTAINLPGAKNWIGAIHQPLSIFIDIQLLKHQTSRDFSAGLMESIKHGLIGDATIIHDVENKFDAIIQRDPLTLTSFVEKSCIVKKKIVEMDEKDTELRSLLNYGHTFGHALETLSNYTLRHGEAVALGIAAESYISMKLGYLEKTSQERIMNIIKRYIPQLTCPVVDFNSLINSMKRDKKTKQGIPRFILLKNIGEPLFDNDHCLFKIEESLIQESFAWMSEVFQSNPAYL